jgi:hypothetical protein
LLAGQLFSRSVNSPLDDDPEHLTILRFYQAIQGDRDQYMARDFALSNQKLTSMSDLLKEIRVIPVTKTYQRLCYVEANLLWR